jgi:Zn-dependent M28 family amino/carboxypeptidase
MYFCHQFIKNLIMKKRSLKYLFAIATLFFIGFGNLSAQKISEKQMKKDVEYLASDELEGRDTGSPGEAKAADYVAKRFEKLGISPKGTANYFQSFTFKAQRNSHSTDSTELPEMEGKNVVGYIDNGAPSTVVIGAHFDHLGYGGKGSGSKFSGEGEIHNGADDNASGVAMLLQLAANLKKGPTHNNYLFIAFSGEEKGLFGSNYFAKNPTIDIERVNYMINMDMVGRLDNDHTLAVYGIGTSPGWKDACEKANSFGFKLIYEESGVGPSDHTSFYLQDVPVLHFFTGQHEDYHKPSDDANKINYKGMVDVASYVYTIVVDMDDELKLEFVKTKSEESRKAPKYTVTLGVMPDYMYSDGGMRIDGVSDGGAADRAGMEAGDVVLKMGDVVVEDMMSYMEGLSKFKKGDKTIVKVRRNEMILDLDVEF